MSLIKIERTKCIGCGSCSDVCPSSCIEMNEQRIPQEKKYLESMCIHCGHCVAVCPEGALDNKFNEKKMHFSFTEEDMLSYSQVNKYLKARRSCRVFTSEIPDDSILMQLMEIVPFTPTSHNSSNVGMVVVRDEQIKQGLKNTIIQWMQECIQKGHRQTPYFASVIRNAKEGKDLILKDAPCIIISYLKNDDIFASETEAFLSLELLEFLAPAMGLGSCWSGYTNLCMQESPALIRQFLKLSNQIKLKGALLVGYPKYFYKSIPKRNPWTTTII